MLIYEKHGDYNDSGVYKDHHTVTCTLYRDYVNNQEDLREVLDQLFQVNFVISLRIWIVHRHIQPKVTKGKIVVQEAQDKAGAPPMSLASIQVSSFCQPLQCTAALYSSHLKSKPSLSYLTNIRPWRL